MSPARRPLRRLSATDALAAAMRERILDGEFAPGAALGEVDVATEYGVARPTVRSAIQALVHEGLLRREPNRSAHVPRLTADDMRDLFYVRTPLELAAVRSIVERGLRVPGAEEATRRMERAGTRASWSRLVDADLAFHRALVEAPGSDRLVRAFAPLEAEIRLSLAQLQPRYPEPERLGAEHRELLDAVHGSDAQAALALMRAHLEQGVRDLTVS